MKASICTQLFLVTLVLSGCSDVVTSHYATYQDAVDDNLFVRGWLPEILPETASNMKISNNLDLNTSRGYFDLPTSEIVKFASELRKTSDGKYTYSHGEIGRAPAWVFEIDNAGHVTYELSAN